MGFGSVEIGAGRSVVVFDPGFASSPAHVALASRFRVIVPNETDLAPRALGEMLADWATTEGLEAVGFVGAGRLAPAALWAAAAAGERASAAVLVSPALSPDDDALQPLLTDLKTPKAVLIGTLDGSQPQGAAALYRTRLSRASVVLVYGAGGDIAADRPDAFARAGGDFLDRQGRFAFMTESQAVR